MSQEITLTINLQLKNPAANLSANYQLPNQSIDQAQGDLSDETQTFGTGSFTQINISPAITTLGIAQIRNLDPTNFIQIGIVGSTGVIKPFMRLKATEAYVLRLEPGVAYYAKANTASVKLRTSVFND